MSQTGKEMIAVGHKPPMSAEGEMYFGLGVHAMRSQAVAHLAGCVDGEHVGPIRRVGWFDRCDHCGEQANGN